VRITTGTVTTALLRAAAMMTACALNAATASAATITLAGPLTGSTAGVPFVDLTLSFDANGNPASNITGWELYLSFSGMSPIDSTFALGSVFTPFSADVIELHGVCTDGAPCSDAVADTASAQQFVSLASVFAPHLPTGPGSLFSLRFAVDPLASEWSVSVFGESAAATDPCGVSSALLWEHPIDSTCAIAPFLIIPEGGAADVGVAKIGVAAVPAAVPVPEPAATALVSLGLLVFAARRRR
jgi:hypothetical protein